MADEHFHERILAALPSRFLENGRRMMAAQFVLP
jgi:hypothetical protein